MSSEPTYKVSERLLITLTFLSILLPLIASIVNFPGTIDSPQFTNVLDPGWVKVKLFEKPWYGFAYHAYFIVDFIWAYVLLFAIRNFVFGQIEKRTGRNLFFLLILITYGADAVENLVYMTQYKYWKTLVDIKAFAYALTLVIYLYFLVQKHWDEYGTVFLRFLKTAIYSLIILLILGSLLPRASQVNSIVVNLYNQPLNLLFLLLASPIYAMFLANYPSYLNNVKAREWFLKYKVWLFGTVIYRESASNSRANHNHLNFLYRTLGLGFYTALFYFLSYTSQTNFSWYVGMGKLAQALLVLGIFLLYLLKRIKSKWLRNNYPYILMHLPFFADDEKPAIRRNSDNLDRNTEATPHDFAAIIKPVRAGVIWFSITILAHIVLFVWLFSFDNPILRYQSGTVILSLLCVALQLISYTYYRTLRATYRLVFFDPAYESILHSLFQSDKLTDEEKENAIKFLTQNAISKHKGSMLKLLSKWGFGLTGVDLSFLKFMSIATAVNFVFLIAININSGISIHINSTLIILSYLLFFYGLISLITKHVIYYNYEKRKGLTKDWKHFRLVLFSAILLTLGLSVITKKLPNKLYTLPQQEASKEDILLTEYVNRLHKKGVDRYYIASYGGGLKSNAWTLTVLNELNKKDSSFLDKSVVLSGVSGGGIGNMNMSALIYAGTNEKRRDSIIESISTSNLLSLDITHALGRDFLVNNFSPYLCYSKQSTDRSTKAMKFFARLTGNQKELYTPSAYRSYWKRIYQRKGHFPILIANSTNIRGNQGMAVSVKIEDNSTYRLVYDASDNLLDLKHPKNGKVRTLSFFNANSTTNRFPVISPAAKIEHLGQFNDGGVFENSGLLSAYKMFEAIKKLDSIKTNKDLLQRNVFVCIINSKEIYIKHKFQRFLSCKKEINEISEIGAVLNSGVGLEKLPVYIKAKLKHLAIENPSIEYHEIYLPHLLTVEDVKKVIANKIDCSFNNIALTNSQLDSLVVENNKSIREQLEKDKKENYSGVIEPPMSRFMAKQAYHFMKSMIKHSDTERSFENIL